MNKISFSILRVKSLITLAFLACTFCSPMLAQFATTPVMKVWNLEKDTESPMRLDILHINIRVVGQIATTTMDMSFYNDNNRVMEGSFEFPLAEGQTITRFALDMNGALREGVVVPKELGRKTFETVVRRGVDPGLLEKTVGNNFRMRVYPLPAKGSRRVVLAFEQELTDKGEYDLYNLPLKINTPIRTFSVHAEVYKKEVQLAQEMNALSNFKFDKMNEVYIAHFERDSFIPDKQIAFFSPHAQPTLTPTQIDQTELMVYTAPTNQESGSSYFYLTLRPKAQQSLIKALPKRMTLLWDNSGSAASRNIPKELEVLDAYIQTLGNVLIELIPFNINTMKADSFQINSGNWNALKSVLNAMTYDGGTSLGSIDFSKIKSDEILLFSDGMSTFGASLSELPNTPIYTICSSSSANPNFLRYLSQKTGSMYLNLLKTTTKEAVEMLTHYKLQFISAVLENGKATSTYPSIASPFDKTFSMAGILMSSTATIKLHFGFGTKSTYTRTVTIDTKNPLDSTLLRRIWASKKIADLSLDQEKHKEEIDRTAREFGIVTENTSLIVLENLSDYLENNIVPPIELQKEYFELKSKAALEKQVKTKNQIEEMVKLSKAQTKWWNTNFPVIPKVKKPRKSSVRFTAPVITDEPIEEGEELTSQEELSSARTSISSATVRGTDEEIGVDIMDLRDVKSENVKKTTNTASIQLNAWDPQTPYYKVLQYATDGQAYKTYLKLKLEYGSTPSFYLDAADFFQKAGNKDTALLILSNLAELKLESPSLLRVLGNKLMDYQQNSAAVKIYEKVLKIKTEEPQSYRDLGLAYNADKSYQKAIVNLYEVVKTDWHNRFDGVGLIALNELNNILSLHPELDDSFMDQRLVKREPVNIRVCLTWDTDNCDMDLWVTDPTKEKCFFSHKLTRFGGKISNDMTQGYGPEEYMIKKAKDGTYIVQANYYGSRSQDVMTPVNLHLVFFTNYGTPNQKQKEVTLRLDNKKDVIDIGTFTFKTN